MTARPAPRTGRPPNAVKRVRPGSAPRRGAGRGRTGAAPAGTTHGP